MGRDKESPAKGNKVGTIAFLLDIFLGLFVNEINRLIVRQKMLDTHEAQERFMTKPGSAESISQGPPIVCEQVFLSQIPMIRCH